MGITLMPELPEVETIKNELAPYVVGRTIVGVDVFWDNMVTQPSVAEFKAHLPGKRIIGLAGGASICCSGWTIKVFSLSI